MREAVQTLLDMRRANGDYLIESLTSEEIWGSLFELVTLHSGNPKPLSLRQTQSTTDRLGTAPRILGQRLVTAFEISYHWKYR